MTGRHLGEARRQDKSLRCFLTNKIEALLARHLLGTTFPLLAGPLGPLPYPVKPGASLIAEAYIPGQPELVKPLDRFAPRPPSHPAWGRKPIYN